MAKKPIIKPLFSFVTLRNPQLLNKEEKERGFVYFPIQQKSNSHFLKDLDAQPDAETRRTFLEGKTATFNSLSKREDVEAIKSDLYDFSIWLMRKKDTLTINEINTKLITPVATLTLTQERLLWDNLFYQLLSKQSVAVRDALIQMIVANNFLKKNDSQTTGTTRFIDTDLNVRRLANAYVVIPKHVITNLLSRNNNTRGATRQHYNYLENQLEIFESTLLLDKYNTVKKEIEDVIAINRKENVASYETAYKTYQTNVKTAYDNATKVVDPTTGEVTYQNLVLPDFTYTPVSLFDTNYVANKASALTTAIFEKAVTKGVNTEEQLMDYLSKIINELNTIYYKKFKTKSKTVRFRGLTFEVNPETPPVDTYSISALKTIEDESKIVLSINLVTGYEQADITANTISIRFDDNSSASNLTFNVAENGKENIILSTSPTTIQIPNGVKSFTVSGTITLDNGDEITIDNQLNIETQTRAGGMVTRQASQQKPVVVHHGIKKIGVADFRKVEQEVCCFVPGEVSRVENVLAREYKERATRQLVSSKTVSETTKETETENLTDTTTTERNELSSEVATILNEEQSQAYGASAGVNGKIGNHIQFNAQAYFDGATSSSSSNSNTTAQNYAEEVTTRALERIVQKVTRKRITTILREYEETNKHGFDNRGGDNHVTGVYRWVDKIYNNRLVNYGKRLMYEFNVPEPSRFFKHAIIQTIAAENTQQVSGVPSDLILPEKPVWDSRIHDARSINEYNYQQFAALYNAEVTEPPKMYKIIGKSFSFVSIQAEGGNFEEMASGEVTIETPEGYEAFLVKVKAIDSGDYNNDNYGIKVLVAGRTPTQQFWDPIAWTTKVPVSYSSLGASVGNITVSIKCQRTTQAYKNWKNQTYKAIRDAFQERINEYNDAVYATFEPEPIQAEDQVVKTEFNPLLNRALEKRELKRIAIDMIARPFGINLAKNNYGSLSTLGGQINLTNVVLGSSLDKQAKYVKFFEQAFDWEIMAYIFYPYYYGAKADWETLFQQSNGTDPVFQAFLQSGMARMVVPIRPGFEKAVTYFMETGEVMVNDQIAIDRDDELYLSIAEEMEQPQGIVEKEWETRVPTSLTIVQANSAPLNENGLPCCQDGTTDADILGFGTSVMVPKPDPVTP